MFSNKKKAQIYFLIHHTICSDKKFRIEESTLKRISVVTNGGDAPGMNATIRAVIRITYSRNFQVLDFEKGWKGLLTNSFRQLARAMCA